MALAPELHLYQGNLQELCVAADQQITLLYKGQKIRTQNGIFTVSLEPRWRNIILLFANPVSLIAHGDENVVNYLTILQKDATHAYECTPYMDEDSGMQKWRVKHTQLPQSFKDNEKDRVVIPLNTIIIPLPGSYFVQQQGIMQFKLPMLKPATPLTLLPEPQVSQTVSQETLQRNYAAAHIVLMNLLPLHSPQKVYAVTHDQLQIEQIR